MNCTEITMCPQIVQLYIFTHLLWLWLLGARWRSPHSKMLLLAENSEIMLQHLFWEWMISYFVCDSSRVWVPQGHKAESQRVKGYFDWISYLIPRIIFSYLHLWNSMWSSLITSYHSCRLLHCDWYHKLRSPHQLRQSNTKDDSFAITLMAPLVIPTTDSLVIQQMKICDCSLSLPLQLTFTSINYVQVMMWLWINGLKLFF